MNTKTKTKFLTVPLMALTFLAGGLGLQVNQADAALQAFGSIDPANGFPTWYQDSTDLKLGLCSDQNGMCLTEEPNPGAPISFPDNFGPEMFWWSAESALPGGGLLVLAMEAAFANENPVDGDQISFGRVRIRVPGLTIGESYTVVHPFSAAGGDTFVATNDGSGGGEINVTQDIGIAGTQFVGALSSSVGPFLTWPNFAAEPSLKVLDGNGIVRQYVGNPAVAHVVTGSPTGNNLFSVSGTGINESTTLFTVSGKLFAPFVNVIPLGTSDTTPTITGTILGADGATTVNVTVGTDPANADIVATVDSVTGTWSVDVPTALTIGLHDVTVTTDLGTPTESDTVKVSVLNVTTPSSTVFRFFSQEKQGHFFTTSEAEKDNIIANDPSWRFEGTAFQALNSDDGGASTVYRFYSPQKQHHFFTISEVEKDNIIANDPSWRFEGVSYFAYPAQRAGTTPLYRFFSQEKQGHFFTISETEKDNIIANDPSWRFEGIAYYVPTN